MISKLGKYIPFLFLIICVLIFLDGLVSFREVKSIQQDHQWIINTFKNTRTMLSPAKSTQLQLESLALDASIWHMYITIILSAILNILLLALAYVALMRELNYRSFLGQKKNDFINLAGHELRTPITTLTIFTEILSTRLAKHKDRQTSHILRRMKNQVDEMKNLINDLLDVTKIQLGKFVIRKQTISFIHLIKETIEDIQTTTKKHKITFKGPKHVEAYVDPQRMWQVIANLLTNAIKYSPHGGKIQVVVEKESQKILVQVIDQGIGINRENQSYIFQKYFREEKENYEAFSGLGLGLYLAQQIIQLHGGSIGVKSNKRKGATFFFSLPQEKGLAS